jgi:hypothetical protein
MTATVWRALVYSYLSPAGHAGGAAHFRVVERVDWDRFLGGRAVTRLGRFEEWAVSAVVWIEGSAADFARVTPAGPWELLTAARAGEGSLRVVHDAGELLPLTIDDAPSLETSRRRRHAPRYREAPGQLRMEWAS